MEIDLEEAFKGLLLKNIVIECKIEALMSCCVVLLCDQKNIKYEAATGIIDTILNDFIEKENLNNPLFKEFWESNINSLIGNIPGVSKSKDQDDLN